MTGDAPRFHRALGWGLAASLVLRAALAARATIIETDGAYWAGLAAALERGDFRHGLSTAWPPLYPALISAALRIARMAGLAPAPGTLEICARAVSVVAGALLLVPLYALARRLLSPRAAVIAVTLAAVHPRTLQYSAAALSEATFTLLLLAALALLVAREQEAGAGRAGHAREASSGALFGLAYLARPEGLPLAAAIWITGIFRPPAAGPSTRRTPATRLRPAFALATLAVALPWLLFLHGTLGRWSLGEKGEYNFWRAFATEYAADYPAPAGLAARVNESPEIAPAAAAAGVHALAFTLRHPGDVIGRCARNLLIILASTLPVTLYWPLVPFAVLALFGPRPRGAWPVAATLGALPLLYAPFSVDRRFFVPAVPLLLIACAAGFERAEAWLATRSGSAQLARSVANATVVVLVTLSIAYAFTKGAGFERAPEHRRAGEWLRRAEAGARTDGVAREARRPIVMSRKPWVAFYSGGLIAALPEVAPDSLIALARARGAVLVADERSARADRAGLAPLLDPAAAPAGLRVLHREPGPPALVLYGPGP